MTLRVLSFVLSSTLLSFCAVANAQQTQIPSVQTQQHQGSSSASPQGANAQPTQPSPELQNLIKALTGRWSLAVTFGSNTNGSEIPGEEVWRSGPGGFTLLEEEHLRPPSGDLFLLGIVWWNSTTKDLQGMECQNRLPYTCDVKGSLTDIKMTWDGKQFIIEEQETHDGRKSVWHEVWSEITPTSFTQTGESERPGGTRKRLFTIHATRATSHQ